MYGDNGNKLVQHAKRTLALPTLPPYSTDLINVITREVRDLNTDNDHQLAPFGGHFVPSQAPDVAACVLVNHMAMRRNKRCLMAYHRVRVDKLEEKTWRGEDILSPQAHQAHQATYSSRLAGVGVREGQEGGSQESTENNLSPEEEEYVRGYGELLAEMKGMWTDVDLTGGLEPPRDLFIDVRVLKEGGEVQTEYGSITLTKNSQFYVRQGDVERLIAQGYLQKLG